MAGIDREADSKYVDTIKPASANQWKFHLEESDRPSLEDVFRRCVFPVICNSQFHASVLSDEIVSTVTSIKSCCSSQIIVFIGSPPSSGG